MCAQAGRNQAVRQHPTAAAGSGTKPNASELGQNVANVERKCGRSGTVPGTAGQAVCGSSVQRYGEGCRAACRLQGGRVTSSGRQGKGVQGARAAGTAFARRTNAEGVRIKVVGELQQQPSIKPGGQNHKVAVQPRQYWARQCCPGAITGVGAPNGSNVQSGVAR